MTLNQATDTLELLHSYLAMHSGLRRADFAALEGHLPVQVGHMLRRSRSDLGWSQRYMASQLQVSRAQYMRYESGAAIPRLHTAIQWSLLFGVPPSVLLSQTDYGKPDDAIPPHFFRLSELLRHAPARLFCDTLKHVARILNRPVPTASPDDLALQETWLCHARDEIRSHNLYLTIGANLRLIRQLLGYSQEDMASGLGISTSHFLAIERGEVAYSFLMMPRFSYAMQFPPLALTVNSHYYQARTALARRFETLTALIEPLSDAAREAAIDHMARAMHLYDLHGGRLVSH